MDEVERRAGTVNVAYGRVFVFRRSLKALLAVWVVLHTSSAGAGEPSPGWPQFRGPTGQGIVTQEGEFPITWSETDNIAWKTRIPGAGWSSPVILGNEVWLTTSTESGKALRLLCIDRESGKIEKNIKVFQVDRPGGVHSKNGHASPTPIVSGDRVYVHFGTNGTACVDRSGKVIWKKSISYYHHHGSASSPVLVDGVLILVCDGMTGSFYDKIRRANVDSPQFIVGLDAETGDVRWKTSRKGRHSYCTPLLVDTANGKELVSPGADHVWAYDPLTGEERWRFGYVGYSVIPRPVVSNGTVYMTTGYDSATLLAIRLGGRGELSESSIVWRMAQGVSFTPSPTIVGDALYLVSDNGILSRVLLESGKVDWKQRLGGNYSASPIAIGDRLYISSEEGTTHVVRVGAKYDNLASNRVKGKTLASLAAVDGRFYLRSDKFLYCIAENAQASPEEEPIVNEPKEEESAGDESVEKSAESDTGS